MISVLSALLGYGLVRIIIMFNTRSIERVSMTDSEYQVAYAEAMSELDELDYTVPFDSTRMDEDIIGKLRKEIQ